MRMLLFVVAGLLVAACASMGRPQGGPLDETPPVFVRSNPAPGALNVKRDRIVIEFNENVQIKDAMNKVVVSPAQKNMPKVSAVGRRVTVDLVDSLVPDATYTIDFTDAISDLNEGNELDGFATYFSTGSVIDTLCISGMVFEAETLEPAQGMLVGVHSNLSDTAITTLPFDRVTRTNQLGQFTIRNLKEGSYNIFAIDDVNRDNKWDRTENIAFYGTAITPSVSKTEVIDTLKSSDGADSIVTRIVYDYAPSDILLTWFNENYKAQYMAKYERKQRNKVRFEMGAPSDSLPQLTIVGGPFAGRRFEDFTVLEASPTLDTLQYWIADTALLAQDSLFIAARYLRTDTLDRLSWTTDTLNFVYREPKSSDKSKKKKQDEAADTASAPQISLLKINSLLSNTADVFSRMGFETAQPIGSFNGDAVHLEIMSDTVWVPVETPVFYRPDSLRPQRMMSDYRLQPGGRYRLSVDSLGITDIYGVWNGNWSTEFIVRKLDEYANITINVTNLTGPAVVQLLSSQDKPVRDVTVEDGRAIFRHVMPGTYYMRLFSDRNANGKYDSGLLLDSLQPEDVYYYPKKINLKKNWDIEQSWDLFETPVDLQKPLEIKKNKPKSKRGERPDYDGEDDEDQYYDEFGNPAVDPNDPFGKRKNNRYKNLNDRDNMMNGGGVAGYRGGLR